MTHTLDPIDLDAYFHRIGYGSDTKHFPDRGNYSPTLTTLQMIHWYHARSIPFENLNPLLKQPVPLDLKSLQHKLIQEGRGGYCFEQNLLLRAVLLTLGFQVTNLAARVMWNLPEEMITPRSHMLLRIELDGESYIADVGFGGLTLTAPLLLKPSVEQQTPHELFRLMQTDHTYTMQVKLGQEWQSLYRFDLQEQQLPDYEVSNWYVSTHPNSLFVNSLIVARPDSECRYALRNNQLTTHYLNDRTEHQVLKTVPELRSTLEDVFQVQLPAIAELDTTLQQLVETPLND